MTICRTKYWSTFWILYHLTRIYRSACSSARGGGESREVSRELFVEKFNEYVGKKNVLLLTDVIEHNEAHFQKSVAFGLLDWNSFPATNWLPTIGKRHSHSACIYENSMYVFGGCTATCTTFNDLWRLDLDSRQWVRPITMGSYPSPKACATMLYYNNSFILFGGWSHPSPYPHHQVR